MREFNKKRPSSKPWSNSGSSSRTVRTRRFNNDDSAGALHEAVCAECGKTCKVPFLPVNGRPVYCSDCFEERGNGEGKKRPVAPGAFGRPQLEKRPERTPYIKTQVNDTEKLDIISKKLDKILKTLHYLSTKDGGPATKTKVTAAQEILESIDNA